MLENLALRQQLAMSSGRLGRSRRSPVLECDGVALATLALGSPRGSARDGGALASRRLPPLLARAQSARRRPSTDSPRGAAVGRQYSIRPAVGASPGVYTGRARLIRGPSEFGRLEPGDVLVTAATTESFNIVLPLVAAIVTDSGGLLSHAAIVAREFGIPGVVGCGDATTLITDGAMVRVDGSQGVVTVTAEHV
jgi:phosphohistidine swiveling domain-containing protein